MSSYTISAEEMQALKFASAMLAAYGDEPPAAGLLYRHRDRDGVLLYIGISDVYKNRERQKSHARTARWWPYVDRIDYEEMPTRRDASRAEPVAIRSEHPVFNRTVQNGTDQPEREAAYLASGPVVVPGPTWRRRMPQMARRRARAVALDLGDFLMEQHLQ
ncbi:hypothetical protein [Pseudonocardia sp. 73-21]|uniref:hypothetical protein n=1 Tax=Pseudonocardia sp. 73-21 TaxID=1895809 RepID=UPI00096256C6|nr:hypothetical protein [Pseudonocardia sp. 73-21]OJY47575.1 MAG: hypothetical protein BGP03_33120 [Pseudonocardia sp. 73-21]